MKKISFLLVVLLGFATVSCDKNKEHYTTVSIVSQTDHNVVIDKIVYENLKTDVKQTSTSLILDTSDCGGTSYKVCSFKLNEDYLSGQKYKVSVYFAESSSLTQPAKLMYLKDNETICNRLDQGSWLQLSEAMIINDMPLVFEKN